MDSSAFGAGFSLDVTSIADGSILSVANNVLDGAAEISVILVRSVFTRSFTIKNNSAVAITNNNFVTYGWRPSLAHVNPDGGYEYVSWLGGGIIGGVWVDIGSLTMEKMSNFSVILNTVTVSINEVPESDAGMSDSPSRIVGAVLEAAGLVALRSAVIFERNSVRTFVRVAWPHITSLTVLGLAPSRASYTPAARKLDVAGDKAIGAVSEEKQHKRNEPQPHMLMNAQQASDCPPRTRPVAYYIPSEFHTNQFFTTDPFALLEASAVRIERNDIEVNINGQEDTNYYGPHDFVSVIAQSGRTLLSNGSLLFVSHNTISGTILRPRPSQPLLFDPSELDSLNMIALLLPGNLLARGGSALTTTHNTFVGRSEALLGTFTGVQFGPFAQSAFCHASEPYSLQDFPGGSLLGSLKEDNRRWGDEGHWGTCHFPQQTHCNTCVRDFAVADDDAVAENEPPQNHKRKTPPLRSHNRLSSTDSTSHIPRSNFGATANGGNEPPVCVGIDDSGEDGDLSTRFVNGYENGARTDISALLGEDPMRDLGEWWSSPTNVIGLEYLHSLFVSGRSTVRIDSNAFDHYFVSATSEGGVEDAINANMTISDLLRRQERLVFLGGDHLKMFVTDASLFSVSRNAFGRRDPGGTLRPSAPTAASYLGISLEGGQVLSATNGSTIAIDRNEHAIAVRVQSSVTGSEDPNSSNNPRSCFATLQGTALNFSVVVVEAHSRVSLSSNRLKASSDAMAVGRAKGFVIGGQCDAVTLYSFTHFEDIELNAMYLVRYNSTLAVDNNAFSYTYAGNASALPRDLPVLRGAAGAAVLAPWAVALVMADARLSVSGNGVEINVPTRDAAHPVGAGLLAAGHVAAARSAAVVSGNNVTITLANPLRFDFDGVAVTFNANQPPTSERLITSQTNTATGVFLCAHPIGRLPAIYNVSAANISDNTVAISALGNAYGVQAMTCDVLGISTGGTQHQQQNGIDRTCGELEACEDECRSGKGFVKRPWGHDHCDGSDECPQPDAFLCDYDFGECGRSPPDYYYYLYSTEPCRDGRTPHGGACIPHLYQTETGAYLRCRYDGQFVNGVTRCVDECDGKDAHCKYYEDSEKGWRDCYAKGEDCDPTHYYCEGQYKACHVPDHLLQCNYFYYTNYGEYACCKDSVVVGGPSDGSACAPQYYYASDGRGYTDCGGKLCTDQCNGKDALCDYRFMDFVSYYHYALCDGSNPYACNGNAGSRQSTHFQCNGAYVPCQGPQNRDCKFYYYDNDQSTPSRPHEHRCCKDGYMYYEGSAYPCEAHYYYNEASNSFERCRDGGSDTICTDQCEGKDTLCRYYYDESGGGLRDCIDPFFGPCGGEPNYYHCYDASNPGPLANYIGLHPCRGHNGAIKSRRMDASDNQTPIRSENIPSPNEMLVQKSTPFAPAAADSTDSTSPSPAFYVYPSLQSLVGPSFNALVLRRYFSTNGLVAGGLPIASDRTELDGQSTYAADRNTVRVTAIGQSAVGIHLRAGRPPPNTDHFPPEEDGSADGALAIAGASIVSVSRNNIFVAHEYIPTIVPSDYNSMVDFNASPFGIFAPHVFSLEGLSAARIDDNSVRQTTVLIGLLRPSECDRSLGWGTDYNFIQRATPAQILIRGRGLTIVSGSTYSIDGNSLQQETAVVGSISGLIGAVVLDGRSSLSLSRNTVSATRSGYSVRSVVFSLHALSAHGASTVAVNDNSVEIRSCADVSTFYGIHIGFRGAALVGNSTFNMDRNAVLWEHSQRATEIYVEVTKPPQSGGSNRVMVAREDDESSYIYQPYESIAMLGAGSVTSIGTHVPDAPNDDPPQCTQRLTINATSGEIEWANARTSGLARLWGPTETTVIASGSAASMADNRVAARPAIPSNEGNVFFAEGITALYFLTSTDSALLMLSDPSTLPATPSTGVTVTTDTGFAAQSVNDDNIPAPSLSIERNTASLHLPTGALVSLLSTPTTTHCEGHVTIAGNDVAYTKGGTVPNANGDRVEVSYGIRLPDVTDRTGSSLTISDNTIALPLASTATAGVHAGACAQHFPVVLAVDRNTVRLRDELLVDPEAEVAPNAVGVRALLEADDSANAPTPAATITINVSQSDVNVVNASGDEAASIAPLLPARGIAVSVSSTDGSGSQLSVTADAANSRVRIPPRHQHGPSDAATAVGLSIERRGLCGGVPSHFVVDGADVRVADGIGVAVADWGSCSEARDAVSDANVSIDVLCMGRSAPVDGCRGIAVISDGFFPMSSVVLDGATIVVRVAGLQTPPQHIHALYAGAAYPDARCGADGLNFTVASSRLTVAGEAGDGLHLPPPTAASEAPTIHASPIRLHFSEAVRTTIRIHQNLLQLDLLTSPDVTNSNFNVQAAFVAIAAGEGSDTNLTGTVFLTHNHLDSPLTVTTIPMQMPHLGGNSRTLRASSDATPAIGTVIVARGELRTSTEQTNLTFIATFDPSGTEYTSFAECNAQQGEDMYNWPNKYNDTVAIFRGFKWDAALPCQIQQNVCGISGNDENGCVGAPAAPPNAKETNIAGGVVAGAAAIFLLFGDGTAVEVQLMVLLMQSASASAWDRDATDVLRYFLAPFVHWGDMAAVVGNVCIAVCVLLMHGALVLAMRRSEGHLQQHVDGDATTVDCADGALRTESPQRDSRAALQRVAARVLFPAVPLVVARALYAGVVTHTFKALSGGDATEAVVCGVIGLTYALVLPAAVLLIIRQIPGSYIPQSERPNPPTGWRRSILPRGFWTPYVDRRLLLGSVGECHGPQNRIASVAPFAVILFASLFLDGIPLGEGTNGATARYAVLLIECAACALLIATRRPFRSLVSCGLSTCAFASLVLLCGAEIAASTDGVDASRDFRIAAMSLVIIFAFARALYGILMLVMESTPDTVHSLSLVSNPAAAIYSGDHQIIHCGEVKDCDEDRFANDGCDPNPIASPYIEVHFPEADNDQKRIPSASAPVTACRETGQTHPTDDAKKTHDSASDTPVPITDARGRGRAAPPPTQSRPITCRTR